MPSGSKGKSLLYGLKREIVVWVKRKVLVVWSEARKTPSGSKGKSLLYGLKREIVVWVKRKVLVVWSEARKRRLGQKESHCYMV